MKKNDEFVVTIDDIGFNMEGIAHIGGQTVFVPFAIPGEKVKVHVINTKSNNPICKVVEIIEPSKDRVEPLCPYFTKCGGCDCQHISYPKQLELKRIMVATTLSKMLCNIQVNPLVASGNYRYRNKMALPIVESEDGTQIGMYRVGSHRIIALKDCLISKDFASSVIKATESYIMKYNIKGYNELDCSGALRHVVARVISDEILVTLVSTTKNLPDIEYYVKQLQKYFDRVNVNINVNNKNTNVIFGDKFFSVYGNDYIKTSSNGIRYQISSLSFMQVNDEIREAIYKYVLDSVSTSDNVVDAYSGAGLLTAMLSTKCKNAYGIEIIESAVKNADELVKLNGLDNVTNILGDCAVELPKLLKTLHGKTTLVLDPPRKGCSEKVLDAILSTIGIGNIKARLRMIY
ncbi:MAG: 23S rRNA (uracil(1939)-C(5))-methyltransferase RlmD, partial [Clostridia bacterium]|nr:23S rRNA (uracil(1939)-C(5))-methyltransferase RlmD [Clostridia bacterium]